MELTWRCCQHAYHDDHKLDTISHSVPLLSLHCLHTCKKYTDHTEHSIFEYLCFKTKHCVMLPWVLSCVFFLQVSFFVTIWCHCLLMFRGRFRTGLKCKCLVLLIADNQFLFIAKLPYSAYISRVKIFANSCVEGIR